MNHSTRLACLALVTLAACGDDPVRVSEPVGINLKAKSSDTVGGVVSDEKGITTESGNPYGKFVSDARAALGGKDPSEIALEGLTLTLGAGSTGVTMLGEVFTGQVDVVFVMNDTNNTVPAGGGAIAATTGGGPATLAGTFTSTTLGAADLAKVMGGSFKVVIRGPAGADFETKGADADLQLTLTFAAYE
ncbi:MAG: hypothetical protein IPL61_02880 [Myxococcales bacterium]|nr:hypothetical protein [Myxococcales bacterium]